MPLVANVPNPTCCNSRDSEHWCNQCTSLAKSGYRVVAHRAEPLAPPKLETNKEQATTKRNQTKPSTFGQASSAPQGQSKLRPLAPPVINWSED